MPHMIPEYLAAEWWTVETDEGATYVPTFDFTREEAAENFRRVQSVEEFGPGVGVRLSAPGYLDCTEWDVFKTEEEAREFVREFYEVNPDTGADLNDIDHDEEEI